MLPYLITGADFTDWLTGDGIRIAAIIGVAVAIDFALHRMIPRALRLTVERQMKERDEEEIQQRVDTLASVFTAGGRVIIVLVTLLTLMPLAGISIGPLLAGVGILGLAVGFGAQSLVKDVISGLLILLDNQYSKGDVVTVCDTDGREYARGLSNYSADQIARIKGLKTGEIAAALSHCPYDEVIHRDNLAVLGGQ